MKMLLIILVIFQSAVLFSQEINFELLPASKFYKAYQADALAHQFSLSKHLESVEWFGNIGNAFALINVEIEKMPVQLSAAATAFNTIIKTPGHIQVYTIDYLVDFYADAPVSEKLILRFLMGHLSAHYADDGIIELGFYSINYVRDYVGMHSQYNINILNGRIYAGVNYNFHNEPGAGEFLLQTGVEARKSLSNFISLYAALDLKFKTEVNYGSTQNYQIGIQFNGSSKNTLRLAYTHRRGFEERGQLFNEKDIKNTIGFYLDF